jgi:hypothetical protein
MDLPDGSLRDHEEAEGGVAEEAAGPAIVRSVEAVENLIQIVRSSHLHFPVVVLEHVVAIVELARISNSLAGLEATGTAEGSSVINIATIERLGRLESLVVPARVAGKSTTGGAGSGLLSLGSESSAASAKDNTLSVLHHHSISQLLFHDSMVDVALTMVLLREELSIIFF